MKTTTALATITTILLIASAQADDRDRRESKPRREHHDYIIERQESGAVTGVPTERRIIGRREIDIYPNGLMFEGNNVVGVKH